MILPHDDPKTGPRDRHALYRNLERECGISREERRNRGRRMRVWYLTGSAMGGESMYNKLREFVDTSTSYLYAPDTTKFGIALPAKYGDEYLVEQGVCRDELQRLWHDEGDGLTANVFVEWAHVWDGAVSKVIVNHGIPTMTMLPDPADFGVLREGIPSLDKQEALCHWYPLDVPTFRRRYRDRPDLEELVAYAERYAAPQIGSGQETLPPTMSQILIAATSPNIVGNVQQTVDTSAAIAKEGEPVVYLAELWVWDDEKMDYRVVTIFQPTEAVLSEDDAKRVFFHGEQPFDYLTLNPMPDYLWGISPIDLLKGLQQWRELRMGQIDRLLSLQLNAPMAFIGIGGITDEKAALLRQPGGNLVSSLPGGKVENMAPPMPPDAFAEINEIDRQFANLAGLPQMLQGQGEPGMRAGDQVGQLATLGSARLRRRAMLVEAWIESVATKMIRMWCEVSGEWVKKPDGQKFYLAQMPKELVARVSAHSASPLYAELIAQKAMVLKQAGAISTPRFVEMMDVPMSDLVIAEARKIDEGKAEMSEKLMAIREELAKHGKRW